MVSLRIFPFFSPIDCREYSKKGKVGNGRDPRKEKIGKGRDIPKRERNRDIPKRERYRDIPKKGTPLWSGGLSKLFQMLP